MGVATRLRQLRLDRGLTQQQLAEPRYTGAFVSTIEAGRRRPSPAALEHFASRLGVDAEELETGVSRGERALSQIAIQEARALVASGKSADALAVASETESKARAFDWSRELGQALMIKALVDEQGGRVDSAIELFDEAEGILGRISSRLSVDALAGKCRCLQIKGDLRYAIHLLETRLRVLREEGIEDPGAIARVSASLVAAYFEAGLRRQAEEAAQRVVDLIPFVSDPDRLANMHINTARVLLDQGRFDEVRHALERAEELYVDLQWKNDIGRVHLARGFTLINEGRHDEAIFELERAARIFAETRNAVNEARCAVELARAHRHLGRISQAKLILRSVGMADAAGLGQQGVAHRELALCHKSEGQLELATEHLESALALFERAQDLRELARTYRLLGDVMRDQNSLAAACDAYRSAAIALEDAA